MGKKLLFIINPKAGKIQTRNELLKILDIFTKYGYEISTYPTQSCGDAKNVTSERAKDYDLLVCSGGDGTLSEVVSGMMASEKKIPIGYIPAGSANDFAHNFDIPKNKVKAASLLMEGRPYPCDVGAFNDSNFIYVAAFGIFTDVPYETKQEVKNVIGYLAYILEGMKRLNKFKPYKLTIECNNNIIEDEFILGMVTNSTSVAGFKNKADEPVLLDDGLFEVTLVKKPHNPIELQEIISALLTQNHTKHLLSFKTDKITIKSEEDIAWTLDGEYGGKYTLVNIKNLRQAVTFIAVDKK